MRPENLPHGDMRPENTDKPDTVEPELWNGIRPPEGEEYQGAMDSWKESIGKPMKPGQPGGQPGGFPQGFRPDGGISNQPWSGIRRSAPVLKTLSGAAKPK